MDVKRDIRFRVYITYLGMSLLGIAIITKAALIQVKDGPRLKVMADSLFTKTQVLDAERGAIYSEDGRLLSTSIPEFDIRMDMKAVQPDTFRKYVDTLSGCIANLLQDGSKADYKNRLKTAFKNKERYFLLRKKATYGEYLAMRDFPLFNKGKNKSGFIAESKTKRINPFGMLANRTVGLWRQNAQNVGLEATYNKDLSGTKGQRVVRRIAGGTWLPVEGSEVEPQNGRDIYTTIDINVQDVAEQALHQNLVENEAQYGTCIVMEVATGKIKALANLGRTANGEYWENLNYAMMPTEPGSTFKLATMLSLFEDGYVDVQDKVNAQGGLARFGNRTMKDSHLGLGVISVKQAFAHSSNVCMALLATNYYYKNPVQYWEHLHRLRLDTVTGLDLIGEVRPRVKSPTSKVWGNTTLPWMAIGYEVQVSPLQTCMMYNAIANNGKMMKPYLVSTVQEYGQPVKETKPVMLAEVCSQSTVKKLKECLQAVIDSGTGKSFKTPLYTIGAKTGTALVADGDIKYSDRIYQASFVGFFPVENPMYTICIVIRNRKGAAKYYGGSVSGPVFKAISDRLYAREIARISALDQNDKKASAIYAAVKNGNRKELQQIMKTLGVPYQSDAQGKWVSTAYDSVRATLVDKPLIAGAVPDVSGMGLKDAIYLLENAGLHVVAKGKGKVITQSIAGGTRTVKGQTIIIELS